MMTHLVAFYIFAAICRRRVAAGVIGQRNPMHSVMLLIASFGALAGLYVLLDAPFTAVTQIIIYAGAIMVLFLFVVMLLNVPREEPAPRSPSAAARADRRCEFGAVLSAAAGRRAGLGAVADRRRPAFSGADQAASVSSVARHRPGAVHRRTRSRSK